MGEAVQRGCNEIETRLQLGPRLGGAQPPSTSPPPPQKARSGFSRGRVSTPLTTRRQSPRVELPPVTRAREPGSRKKSGRRRSGLGSRAAPQTGGCSSAASHCGRACERASFLGMLLSSPFPPSCSAVSLRPPLAIGVEMRRLGGRLEAHRCQWGVCDTERQWVRTRSAISAVPQGVARLRL